MTLGERIQALRKSAGMSQEELGDRLGVARQSVSKWESGATVPELDKLIAMSKLFGVSVGSLLGLEESEGPDHELTQRELKALEAIAQRLVPPAAEPKKRKRWPFVLAAVAVAVAGWALMSRIHNLENQIGGLHYNISNIDNTVSRQISSLTGQVREILEEQNSVTAGKGYEILEMNLERGTVTFSLTATPREYREGMRAVFSAVGAEFEPVEIPGTLGAGQTFTAELTCPLTDNIILSVGFVGDGAVVTQQLGEESYLLSGTKLNFNGNLGWSVGSREGKIVADRMDAYLDSVGPGQYKTAEGWQDLGLKKGCLRLWVNGELFWSGEEKSLEKREETAIPAEGLELKRGDRVILSLLYTDSAGREGEAYLDGLCINGEGRPEMLAPYEEETAFPWE
jgi:transcriptional regulator with XRE-family HTH domain